MLATATSHSVTWLEPMGANHVALEVVACAVATDVAASHLHGRAIRGKSCPVDLERERPGRQRQQRRLPAAQHDRLDHLASTHDPGRVPLGKDVVERPALEVDGEEPREALCGETRLLENERFATAKPKPLEVDDGSVGGDAELAGRPPRRQARFAS